METPLLQVKNLNIYFGKGSQRKQVVFNLNLNMNRGEVVGVVGESGSGKSVSALSLMRLINNAVVECESMDLFDVDNQVINLLKADNETLMQIRGKRVSYIFQEPMTALHPLFTCGAQLVEGILVHQKISKHQANEKAIQLFTEMELPNPAETFDSYPHQLSGGQRQRVMIALALSNDPELLIADEPTTALDSVLQRKLTQQMVDGCKKRNVGLLLISHDVQLIKDFTHTLMVMYNGRVVEHDKTETVVNHPKSLYTQSLLSCQPNFAKRSFVLPTVKELAVEQNGEFTGLDYVPKKLDFQPIDRETPYISVRNISKEFNRKGIKIKAVDNVSFDIFKGETLGLVGESGCGKSTLSRIIINLMKADNGVIEFQSGKHQSQSFARAVQMIFQDPYSSLNPTMRVGEMLSEVLIVHNIVKGKAARLEKVAALLKEVGLKPEDASKYPHEFSGGQRQRVSIARALAVEPDLIICDESVSALDVSIQAQILNLFNELKIRRQLTYLFISHDLKVVSYLCDRILVMKEGRVLEINDTEKIIHSPKHEYTKHLLGVV